MSRLNLAMERLSAALTLLDTRLGEASRQAPSQAADEAAEEMAVEFTQLSAERDALRIRVAELEEESRALSVLTAEVEDRLDGTIAEIRQILGRG
jgi:hypothetical protein